MGEKVLKLHSICVAFSTTIHRMFGIQFFSSWWGTICFVSADHTKALAVQESSSLNPMNWSAPRVPTGGDVQSGDVKAKFIANHMQRQQDHLQKLGYKIKHHEDNLRFLKTQMDKLDESIHDMLVNLGKYHASTAMVENENLNHFQTEENTIEQIRRQENSAAGLLCQLKRRHAAQASHLPFTKDVLGILANLGKVEDDNLSRLFSEYLGLETMMAIVCETKESVKALEPYDAEGRINNRLGLHGLGLSIGRPIDGRFLVICLEDLRPYAGDFVADDPQRRLALLKPRLPSGESPPGFLGFAVNMMNFDSTNLSYLTASGHGLRETLFYNLFSDLQVYRTRGEMLLAAPCISNGAISLDGGMIRRTGVFFLGNRKEVEVRFPVSSGTSSLPLEYVENENRVKALKWERERVLEDMDREQALLHLVKKDFDSKKLEFFKFIAENTAYTSQFQVQAGSHMNSIR